MDSEILWVKMEVDLEEYPLDSITNYDQYTDLKPPETPLKMKKVVKEEFPMEMPRKGRRSYRKYTDADKEDFFELIYEKGLNISQAAKKLGMPVRTAQGWYDRDQSDPQDVIQRNQAKKDLLEGHQNCMKSIENIWLN
ncbi:hypothetical protein CLU79DRAFT_703515 [Phycomyces nitens]|nr:hypothetical protein CLU79DRAFT_703515 [Phycomyces nitens]